MRTYINMLVLTSAVIMIMSCETGSPTDYEEKLVLYCYAKADSTIDSLYLSRTGRVNESISMNNLGVSGATVTLSAKSPGESIYYLSGNLIEYPEREGVYFLPEEDFPSGFIPGYSYRIEVTHENYDGVFAETVCPSELTGVVVKNVEKDAEMVSMEEDPDAVDTLFYRRGKSFDDIKLIGCRFDSLLVLSEERMASFRITPDEISRLDTSFWLEDTTEAVWKNYPIETRIFKDREKYGTDFTDYYLRSISVYWYALYHEGMHTVVFSSTDRAFRSYMESLYGGEERYSNVINGIGLFTISNSSAVRSRYRVYVKSLEEKYPLK